MPSQFKSRFEVVSCFCECDGKFVALLRQDHKSEGNKWGPPAGKVDANETIGMAIAREVFEETGILARVDDFYHHSKVFVRYPEYDFIYHIFHLALSKRPRIIINTNEHKDFRRVTPNESLKLSLVRDEGACIKLFYDAEKLPGQNACFW